MVQLVLRGEIKCMRVQITCEEWKIWGELKGSKSEGGKEKLIGKIKGADSAQKRK